MDATSQTSLAHGRDRNVDVLFTGPLVSCPRQRRGASRFACENAPVDCGMTSLIAGTPSTSAAQEALGEAEEHATIRMSREHSRLENEPLHACLRPLSLITTPW